MLNINTVRSEWSPFHLDWESNQQLEIRLMDMDEVTDWTKQENLKKQKKNIFFKKTDMKLRMIFFPTVTEQWRRRRRMIPETCDLCWPLCLCCCCLLSVITDSVGAAGAPVQFRTFIKCRLSRRSLIKILILTVQRSLRQVGGALTVPSSSNHQQHFMPLNSQIHFSLSSPSAPPPR